MKFRWRIVLSFGNLAVDCLVLVLWLFHAPSLYRPKADASPWRIEPVLLFQEGGSFVFDPKSIEPPAEFLLLASGSVPAMLVSGALRPEAHILTLARLWDPVWFLIHETISFLLWFGIGALIDSGLMRIKKTMMAYLVTRFGFAVLLTWHRVADVGWRVEVLFWLAFVVYAVIIWLRWAFSKLHWPWTTVDS
jgi:hypothetical protein